jgi:periplasmic protein TonB
MALENGCAIVAEGGGCDWRIQALAALCALLAGCAAPGPGGAPGVAKSYHSMPQASVPLPPPSAAATLDEYRLEVAGLLQTANRGMVFEGAPPNPLRAVIVMRAEIDVLGEARRLDVVRAPWHDPWLAQLVAQTMRQAEPFPRPSMKLLKGANSVTITETWLFDYEGRFRLRSLSQPQAALLDADETP